VDALPCLDPDGSIRFGRLKVQPRGGDYLLYAVTQQTEFRQVGQSAPGGEGLVLDHYNQPAVERYLNRISDALTPVLGGRLGGTFRSVLSESIELGDANWTSDFAAQFVRRRGYSLDPYLALVLLAPSELAGTPLGDAVRRARYDFHKTHAELMLERFYRPFHEWCRRHGVQSRLQAYGHPWLRTHLLDGYMVPDIPEGDTWVHWGGAGTLDGVRYAVWNKYASSAAHLAGRRIVGAETLTNLEGVFQASLADAKQGADLTFAGGVNHLVLHGFNYSPPETGFPGWLRYGTWFSEQNPWWRYVRRFADYAARVSWVLQSTEPRAEVAILGPGDDVWSLPAGLNRELWVNTPWYLHDLWQAFHQTGCCVDYISPAVLLGATTEEGQLRYNGMRYRALLVVEAESMEPEVAQALSRHAERGGRVVFIGRTPDRAPGLRQSDEAVRAAIAKALPRATVAPAPERDAVLAWVRRHAHDFAGRPPVELAPPDARLFQVRRSLGGRDILFLANSDRSREIAFTAALESSGKTPWRWDAETGARSAYPVDASNRLSIRLAPLESMLLVFEPSAAGNAAPIPAAHRTRGVAITTPWTVALEPVEGPASSRALPALVDFASDPALASFSGLAAYRTEFYWDGGDPVLLDLGRVHETSEVVLNGKPLGVRWWGRHEYETSGVLRKGRNLLEVKVTTLAFNYCRSLKQNAACAYWVNRSGRKQPLPAGLLGPVRLMPLGKP